SSPGCRPARQPGDDSAAAACYTRRPRLDGPTPSQGGRPMFWLEMLCEVFFALFFGSGPLAWMDVDRPATEADAVYSVPCACPPGMACPAGCCKDACPCKAGINICCPTEFACAPGCPATACAQPQCCPPCYPGMTPTTALPMP